MTIFLFKGNPGLITWHTTRNFLKNAGFCNENNFLIFIYFLIFHMESSWISVYLMVVSLTLVKLVFLQQTFKYWLFCILHSCYIIFWRIPWFIDSNSKNPMLGSDAQFNTNGCAPLWLTIHLKLSQYILRKEVRTLHISFLCKLLLIFYVLKDLCKIDRFKYDIIYVEILVYFETLYYEISNSNSFFKPNHYIWLPFWSNITIHKLWRFCYYAKVHDISLETFHVVFLSFQSLWTITYWEIKVLKNKQEGWRQLQNLSIFERRKNKFIVNTEKIIIWLTWCLIKTY